MPPSVLDHDGWGLDAKVIKGLLDDADALALKKPEYKDAGWNTRLAEAIAIAVGAAREKRETKRTG